MRYIKIRKIDSIKWSCEDEVHRNKKVRIKIDSIQKIYLLLEGDVNRGVGGLGVNGNRCPRNHRYNGAIQINQNIDGLIILEVEVDIPINFITVNQNARSCQDPNVHRSSSGV